MIPIVSPDINNIASLWADRVNTFLTEKLVGCHQVRYTDTAGDKKLFDNRLKKYRYMYSDRVASITDISKVTKDSVWAEIEKVLGNKYHFIGDKNYCEKWKQWHDDNLADDNLRSVVNDIFVNIYEEISADNAYEILQKMNVRTCPYCNRHYTFTLQDDGFKTRPEFDHFYDKSTYPLLAATFFNLVPSCKECNHIKTTKSCGVNPHFDKFESRFIIQKPDGDEAGKTGASQMNINEIFGISKDSEFSIGFHKPNDTEEANIKALGLLPLYNSHKDYVMEIVEKAAAYNQLARSGIVDSFQGLFHSETDVYHLIFGRYLSDASHSERPFSKLTADILSQLEISCEPHKP